MPRPEFITHQDIMRWSSIIDNEPLIKELVNNPIIREVCYAGQYLTERLVELQCPEELISRIVYTGGELSFGRPDPWIIHRNLLDNYLNGILQSEKTEEI